MSLIGSVVSSAIFWTVIWTELLELLGGVTLDELDELETAGALDELETTGTLDELDAIPIELEDSGSGQFSPMQNVSVSPDVPMSVILSPVFAPLYQVIAG